MRAFSKFPVDFEEETQPRGPAPVTARPSDNVVHMQRNAAMFTGLPPGPRRRKYFLISFIVQTIVFAVLIKTGVLNPPAALKQKLGSYVALVAPSVQIYTPAAKEALPPPPVIARARVQPPLAPPIQVVPPVAPAPKPPQAAEAPRPAAPPKLATAAPAPVPPRVEKKIVTGGFSSGSSAVPNSKLPVQKVQTGGFGDPSGVVPNPNGSKDSKLAKLGSFDLPSGPGTGNGTGGSHGAQAVVASAGFGNGVATMTPTKGSGAGVHAGGFGDMEPAAAPAPAQHAEPAQGKLTPAEILSKPNPVYTEEARRLKIEGEVVLKVNFTVNGQVQVLGVVRGLGHGLDEAAVHAAQGMRFKPAMRDGKPVDSTATVHVLFELT